MDINKYKFTGGKFDLKNYETGPAKHEAKNHVKEIFTNNKKEIAQLQCKLYAEGKQALLILFQAMDGAGKDSSIKHVMSGINPQGVNVHSFKQPSAEELAHGFLWRAVKALPERGKIAIFNRSYYEDVLVVKVHNLHENLNIIERCKDSDVFTRRYGHIVNFENYLWDNATNLIKIFLNVSPDEQRRRFLRRLARPDKNWKFSDADIKERGFWKKYQQAYVEAFINTASIHAPWYIIPADKKWYTHAVISEILAQTLKNMDPQYPEMPRKKVALMDEYRKQLLSE